MANLGYIQLARRCNQKCVFCSNPPNGRIISLDDAKRFVDDFIERQYHGIILTGGEPTLFGPITELLNYARERDIPMRMVSNGQKTADFDYLKSLVDAGLVQLHLSIHSVREKVEDYLTQIPGSFKNQMKSLENAAKLGLNTDINCVINKLNADHLDENVKWLTNRFPKIHHFVWNNLDPCLNDEMDRSVIARLSDFEISLFKAMYYLERTGRSFRVERVPLCYMADYAAFSTETRKIIKDEERIVHFLDQKETVHQVNFAHGKFDICKTCRYEPICAGLFMLGNGYDPKELSPIFLDPNKVVEKVLHRPDPDRIERIKRKNSDMTHPDRS